VTVDVDGDFIYNVAGKGDLVLVDFTGCYAKEGEAPANPPFKVVSDLSGKTIAAVPAGTFVDANDPFPAEITGDAAVSRLENVPKPLRNHGIDAYVASNLATELRMRGHLYRR
jgi:hypothetical protein